MNTFNILVIAPNAHIANMAQEVAANYPDFTVTIHEGDLSQGLTSALNSFDAAYDIVISRGGTAQLLEEEFSIPVVEIGISEMDLFSTLLTYNPTGQKTAVVGFSNALETVKQSASFSNYEIDVFDVGFEDELPLILQKVVEKKYPVVLCDTYAFKSSQGLGLNSFLLSSGAISVSQAFDQAHFLCEQTLDLRFKTQALWQFIQSQPSRLAIFSNDGKLVYSNLSSDKARLISFMRSHLDGKDNTQLTMQHKRNVFRLKRIRVDAGTTMLTAFIVLTSSMPPKDSSVGITYKNADDIEDAYLRSIYHYMEAEKLIIEPIVRNAPTKKLIVLEGEPGSGLSQAAALFYLHGSWKSRPFVTIDCSMLTKESWEFLINGHRSPLYDTDQTLYLRSIHLLEIEQLKSLINAVLNTSNYERNRIVISTNKTNNPDSKALIDDLKGFADCYPLAIPSLHERSDIKELFPLFLSKLAHQADTEPPFITDEAIELLATHRWNRNYAELKQVLTHAYEQMTNSHIDANTIKAALKWSGAELALGQQLDSPQIDLSKSLKDIEKTVVKLVLERCNNNQTEAAESLGVSRTTIWRLLKN